MNIAAQVHQATENNTQGSSIYSDSTTLGNGFTENQASQPQDTKDGIVESSQQSASDFDLTFYDLQAHSLLSAELLKGEGVDRLPSESDADLVIRLWAQWASGKCDKLQIQSKPEAIFYPYSSLLPHPTLNSKLVIYAGLLLHPPTTSSPYSSSTLTSFSTYRTHY